MYLLHIMSLYAIVRRTQLSKLFPKIVDSLRFIYRKYMIMFLRMNMIYTEEKSDLTQTMIWLSLLDGFERERHTGA